MSSAMSMICRQWFRQRLQWSCPIVASRSPINMTTTWNWKCTPSRWSRWTTWWWTWCSGSTWWGSTPWRDLRICRWCLTRYPTGHCTPRTFHRCRTHTNCLYLCWVNITYSIKFIWQKDYIPTLLELSFYCNYLYMYKLHNKLISLLYMATKAKSAHPHY